MRISFPGLGQDFPGVFLWGQRERSTLLYIASNPLETLKVKLIFHPFHISASFRPLSDRGFSRSWAPSAVEDA